MLTLFGFGIGSGDDIPIHWLPNPWQEPARIVATPLRWRVLEIATSYAPGRVNGVTRLQGGQLRSDSRDGSPSRPPRDSEAATHYQLFAMVPRCSWGEVSATLLTLRGPPALWGRACLSARPTNRPGVTLIFC